MNIRAGSKQYHTSAHLVYSCQYHVIFCPKYRRHILKAPYDDALKQIFLEIAEQYQFRIPEMEVIPDHVHMIIDCNPRFGVMECVKKLKGISGNRMRAQFPELKKRMPSLWTRSVFVSSVGCVSLDVVRKYIENQKRG